MDIDHCGACRVRGKSERAGQDSRDVVAVKVRPDLLAFPPGFEFSHTQMDVDCGRLHNVPSDT